MEESSHAVMVNSLALKLLGFNDSETQPQGGYFAINRKTGKPNGILFENAGDIAMEAAWKSQSYLEKRSYKGLLAGLEQLAMHGITTAGDSFMYWRKGWFARFGRRRKKVVTSLPEYLCAPMSIPTWNCLASWLISIKFAQQFMGNC